MPNDIEDLKPEEVEEIEYEPADPLDEAQRLRSKLANVYRRRLKALAKVEGNYDAEVDALLDDASSEGVEQLVSAVRVSRGTRADLDAGVRQLLDEATKRHGGTQKPLPSVPV